MVVTASSETYLDGAALKMVDGTPVVALTLRYDRVDNFWFRLLHELAHVGRHMENDGDSAFVDDLTLRNVTCGQENPQRTAGRRMGGRGLGSPQDLGDECSPRASNTDGSHQPCERLTDSSSYRGRQGSSRTTELSIAVTVRWNGRSAPPVRVDVVTAAFRRSSVETYAAMRCPAGYLFALAGSVTEWWRAIRS